MGGIAGREGLYHVALDGIGEHLIEHMDSILEEFADAEDLHRAAGVLNACAR